MKTLSKQDAFSLLLRDFGGIKGLAFAIVTTKDMIKNWLHHHVTVSLEYAILMVIVSHGKVAIVSFYESDELTSAIQKVSDVITPFLEEMFNSTEFIEYLEVDESNAYLPREFIDNFAELRDFERPVVCDEQNHLITGYYQYEMKKRMGEKLIKIFRVNIKKLLAEPKPIPNILQYIVFERMLVGMRIEEVYKAFSTILNRRPLPPLVHKEVVSGKLARFKNHTEYARLKTIYKCADCETMKQVASHECSIFGGIKRIERVELSKNKAETAIN